MDLHDHKTISREFRKAVNMAPSSLKKWLTSDESKAVGWTEAGDDESVGHHSGRSILAIRAKKTSDLDDADYAHMRKVVGYVHRHLKQKPAGDVRETKWRYSLMNWGHDPLKD